MIRRHYKLWYDIVVYIVLKPREFTIAKCRLQSVLSASNYRISFIP